MVLSNEFSVTYKTQSEIVTKHKIRVHALFIKICAEIFENNFNDAYSCNNCTDRYYMYSYVNVLGNNNYFVLLLNSFLTE